MCILLFIRDTFVFLCFVLCVVFLCLCFVLCFVFVLVCVLSLGCCWLSCQYLAKLLARKTPLRKPNHGERIFTTPTLKGVYDFIALVYCFTV